MEVCPICLENIDIESGDVQTLTCSHKICIDCVYRLIIHGQFKKCPMCRANVNISVSFSSPEELAGRCDGLIEQHVPNYARILRNIQQTQSITDQPNHEPNMDTNDGDGDGEEIVAEAVPPEQYNCQEEIVELLIDMRKCTAEVLAGIMFVGIIFYLFIITK